MRERPVRGALPRVVGLLLVAAALAAGALVLWATDGSARIDLAGRSCLVPVPGLSLRVGSDRGRATYLALVLTSTREVLSAGAARHDFRYVEQAGSLHLLESRSERLHVSEQIVWHFFTRLEYHLASK